MTGEIVGLDVYGEVEGKNIYILDDICDGGYTFTILAKQLYELGAEEVHLVVSHGIFSKGLDPLHKANIVSITTTNSFNFDNNVKHDLIVDPNEYVTVVDIRGLLNAYLNN
jgi:phosphoribosylpyrophosphate synthetase